jgi:hypothetical protein
MVIDRLAAAGKAEAPAEHISGAGEP